MKNLRISIERVGQLNLMEAADLIEEQATEIERLGRELNRAKYGDPDFAWEAHKAALDAAHAEIERLRSIIQSMDDTIVARSELFVSDQECLFNLRDRIRRALNEGEKP